MYTQPEINAVQEKISINHKTLMVCVFRETKKIDVFLSLNFKIMYQNGRMTKLVDIQICMYTFICMCLILN